MNLNYPVIIDGGFATVLEDLGCNLNHKLWSARIIDQDPESIKEVHKKYINSGAEIIATASYQASFPGLMEVGYNHDQAVKTILKSVELAQEAIAEALENKPKLTTPLIGASIGPYGAYLADGSEYHGGYTVSKSGLKDFHQERIQLLNDSDADLLLFETIPDLDELEVIANILKNISKPAWVSFACKDGGHLNDGSTIEKAAEIFQDHPSVFAIGINCTRPVFISELIKRIKKTSNKRIVVYPNSNEIYNPDAKTWSGQNESKQFVELAQEWLREGADLIGGCCRIGPKHIASLANSIH